MVAGAIIWLLMNDSVLQAAGVAFLTVFLAELGDKSQLLALSLSARYRRPVLLAAVLTASALTIGAAVLVGDLIGGLLPTWVLRAGAGILFLVFAALTLFGDDEEEADGGQAATARSGFVTAVLALCAAEFGDKTMVSTFALAATTSGLGVWIGGTLGMALGSGLAVLIGAAVWQRLSPRTVRYVSSALFTVVGVVLLFEVWLG